jgi:sensor histidine kinase YesM
MYLKGIFIPLLGILIPQISGIITYSNYSIAETILADFYFMLISLAVWIGCNWIHARLRAYFKVSGNPFLKIASVCGVCGLYGLCLNCILVMLWFYFSREIFDWNNLYKFSVFCTLAIILFTLVYEILFLSKERELDAKVVHQLDQDRSKAELEALNNEMDPHFIFNSLNTLNHLIVNNPKQAFSFNNKLAQVYKYFLINKNNQLISLRNELEFIDDYFFLLKIRHDNKLDMETELNRNANSILLPPFALQILIENAIKHNEFSNDHPLQIRIGLNGRYLKITNNVRAKPYLVSSTGIGLKNLSSRYKLLCNADIVVEKNEKHFTVKLPLINENYD